jgi:hypothetical protein
VKGNTCFSEFAPVPTLFQRLSHSAVILSVVKTISYTQISSTMARRRILCDEDIESHLICDTDSDEYVEDSQSEDEDDFADEQQPPPKQQQQ